MTHAGPRGENPNGQILLYRGEDGRTKPWAPATVAGTHRILEKGTAAIHARPAAIVIGQPIQTAGMSVDARGEITAQAHAEVARLLEQGDALVRGMEHV